MHTASTSGDVASTPVPDPEESGAAVMPIDHRRTSVTVAALAAVALAASLVTASAGPADAARAAGPPGGIAPRAVDGAPLDNHELLLHTAGSGTRTTYQVNLSGSLAHASNRATFSSRWDAVVPADLDGDGQDELVLHNRSTRAFRFYDVRADGSLGRLLRSGTFGDRWSHVAALDVRGDARDELLLYDATTGRTRLVSVSSQYTLPTVTTRTETRGWDQLVPVDLGGDGRDELILHDRQTGRWSVRDVSSSGAFRTLREATLSRSWTSISAVDFDRDAADELVLYNAADGAFRMYQVSTSGALGTLAQSGTWRTGYTSVAGIDVDPGPRLAGIARQILDRVNAERRRAGLPAVAMRNRMLTEAHRWSQVMADDGRMRHRSDLASGLPSGWRSIGENVAVGYGSASSVMDGWMNSPGHRANILGRDFTHVGIGVAADRDGRLFFTQIFARY
jgi:uncharacterized protein YkwD